MPTPQRSRKHVPKPDGRRALDLLGDGGGSQMRFWEIRHGHGVDPRPGLAIG